MIRTIGQPEQKPGWMFLLSLGLHLVVMLICTRADLFKARMLEATPYYVDIVSLPTAEPAPGELPSPSSPAPNVSPATTPPQMQRSTMSLPVKSPVPSPKTPAASQPSTGSDQEAQAFNERMNRIERSVEGKHQAAALESLQRKVATRGKPGAPGASGSTPGYDYAAYIQSRLKDALATTMVYRSRSPEASVQIYIDKRGKLLRYVMIKPSSDKLFNDSVIRTIEKAKADFPPTPSGGDFDKLYVFSPQEVSKK